MRGSGKPTLPAPMIDTKKKSKKQTVKVDNGPYTSYHMLGNILTRSILFSD